jgi:hypothetical protein
VRPAANGGSVGIGQVSGHSGDPMLEAMTDLIACGQRAVLHECGTEELDRVAVLEVVERLVGDRSHPGDELAQDRRGGGPADSEPVQHAVGGPRGSERGEVPIELAQGVRVAGLLQSHDLIGEVAVSAATCCIEVVLSSAATADLAADDPRARFAEPDVGCAERGPSCLSTARTERRAR